MCTECHSSYLELYLPDVHQIEAALFAFYTPLQTRLQFKQDRLAILGLVCKRYWCGLKGVLDHGQVIAHRMTAQRGHHSH